MSKYLSLYFHHNYNLKYIFFIITKIYFKIETPCIYLKITL